MAIPRAAAMRARWRRAALVESLEQRTLRSSARMGTVDGEPALIVAGSSHAANDVSVTLIAGPDGEGSQLQVAVSSKQSLFRMFPADQVKRVKVTGGRRADTLIVHLSAAIAAVLDGGKGDDTLRGSDGADVLAGGKGDDTVSGGDGADQIDGGKGNDELYGDGGDDQLVGGPGRDALDGGPGADVLIGSADDDTLRGEPGADQLLGGRGRDLLDPTADLDPDVVAGGPGLDTFYRYTPDNLPAGQSDELVDEMSAEQAKEIVQPRPVASDLVARAGAQARRPDAVE